MGISLINPGLASATPPAGIPGLPVAGDPAAAGFADMLALQLLGLGPTPEKPLSPAADDASNDETLANDPALQLLAGLPLPVPPQTLVAPQPGNSAVLPTSSEALTADATTLPSLPEMPTETPGIATLPTISEEAELTNPALAQLATATPAARHVALSADALPAAQPPTTQPLMASLTDPKAVSGKPEGALSANLAAPTANASGSDFLTHLNAQIAHASGTPARAEMASVPTPLRDAAWANDFSEKVVWIARADQQNAQISINPPHLGPIQITLNISGDQATAVFASPHAEVRQAIEDALPRLREMFAGAGIDLGQANVGAQLAQGDTRNPSGLAGKAPSGSDNAILPGGADPAPGAIVSPLRAGRGMVDLFA